MYLDEKQRKVCLKCQWFHPAATPAMEYCEHNNSFLEEVHRCEINDEYGDSLVSINFKRL